MLQLMRQPVRRPRGRAGYTILELMLVVSIIVIIVIMAIPTYGTFRRRAEDGVCMSNLRNLHAGLATYLHDHDFVWPQNPFLKNQKLSEDQEDREEKWWYETLKPYGPTRETWLCPSERQGFKEDNDPDHYDSSYLPTNFDNRRNAAYLEGDGKQPWVIERGGFHQQGKANVIMGTGEIRKDPAPTPFKQ